MAKKFAKWKCSGKHPTLGKSCGEEPISEEKRCGIVDRSAGGFDDLSGVCGKKRIIKRVKGDASNFYSDINGNVLHLLAGFAVGGESYRSILSQF